MWRSWESSVCLLHYLCSQDINQNFPQGLVQFVDLNPDVSAFQRQFVSEVKRCEEMERILRYVETEIVREKIEVTEAREETIAAPAPREMVELESELTTTENNLREVNTNYVALR